VAAGPATPAALPQPARDLAAVAVDLVILTVRGDQLAALLIRRGELPFAGQWALPGGFVRPGEGLDAAAERQLQEETGVPADRVHLEQLASYGSPDRDPRMRVVSVAYLALAPRLPAPRAGAGAAEAQWKPVRGGAAECSPLAFDHDQILADGVERARAKLEYSPLAAAFCPAEFTVSDLRRVYEIVWGTTLDPRNFHRKVTGTAGFLRPTGKATTRERGRPAKIYRKGDAISLHPPMLRAAAMPRDLT
jgi:8-oxo-dGTP diphosphatase